MSRTRKDGRHDDRISPLNIQSGDFITLTGGGGKTSLLFALAEDLPAKGADILATTTTRMHYPGNFPGEILLQEDRDPEDFVRTIADSRSPRIFAAKNSLDGGKVAGLDSEILDAVHRASPERVIFNEGDGAARRPMKFYRPWEPVIPSGTTRIIHVAGCEGWRRPLGETVFRCPPERADTLLDAAFLEEQWTLFLKMIEKDNQIQPWIVINKADGLRSWASGSKGIPEPPPKRWLGVEAMAETAKCFFDRVFIAALEERWLVEWR